MSKLHNLTAMVNGVLHKFDVHVTRYGYKQKSFIDKNFWDIHEKWKDKTMIPWQGSYDAYNAAKYVALNGIEGDIVECGVWKGGSSIIMAETLGLFGCTDRNIYLYDTFAGMTEPDLRDTSLKTKAAAHDTWEKLQEDVHNDWAYASLAEVKENVARAKYPNERFVFVKGDVCKTIPETAPRKISVLRLDTDWYKSTHHELVHLFPRLSLGGVLIVDDYGTYSGARDAVNSYLEKQNTPILLTCNYNYGAVTGVKVSN